MRTGQLIGNAGGVLWRFVSARVRAFLNRPFVVWVCTLLLVFAIYTPGYMSPDSIGHYTLAADLKNLVIYHPPFMPYLFSIGRFFSPDQSGVLLLQLLLYFGGVWFLLSATLNRSVFISFGILLFAFYPALFPIIGVLWKSVWMTCFLLFSFGFALRFWQRPSKWKATGAILFGLLAMLSRYDAIAPVGVVLFFMVGRSIGINSLRYPFQLRNLIKYGRLAFAALAIAGVGVGSMGFLVGRINDTISIGTRYPSYVFLYQDLLSISINAGKLYIPDFIEAENTGLSVETLKAAYNPITCGAFLRMTTLPEEQQAYKLRGPKNRLEADAFKSAWRRAVSSEPMAYLKGRLGLWSALYGFEKRVYYPFAAGVSRNSVGLTAGITPAKRWARGYADFWALDFKLFHRPWLYILTAGLVSAFVVVVGSSASAAVLMLAGGALAHFAVISLVSCAADFRFAFFLVTGVVLATFVAIAQQLESRNVGRGVGNPEVSARSRRHA